MRDGDKDRFITMLDQDGRNAPISLHRNCSRFCRALAFPSADGASEAALCLREDGLPLAELARRASTVVQVSAFFLEELDASVHDRFVGARTGDLIGPVRQNGEYVLYEIVGKTLPSPSDPIVLVRAQEGVLKRAIAHQVANHVQWNAEP